MCGCKGCQEVTTIDLVNNTETTTQLPTEECGPINSTVKVLSCACGITLDIYNNAGILIESNQSGGYTGEDGTFFQFHSSTIWESELGPGYVLTINYNTEEGRWELSYYDDTYNTSIVIGVYYSTSACPTSITSWDLNCISFLFRPRITTYVVTWGGEYFNGKKKYTAYGTVEMLTWLIYWSSVNNRWEIVPDTISPMFPQTYNNATGDCVPTNVPWLSSITNTPTNYQTFPLPISITGYTAKVTPIDCQCCDEKLTITIGQNTETGFEEIEIIADIATNEAGDHLIYNGYPYYIFYIDTADYFIFHVGNQWVVKNVLSVSAPTITFIVSDNQCPFGYYLVDEEKEVSNRFWVKGYNCGDEVEKDFCDKVHAKQCEFATKTLIYLKHLQFGNTCCEELDALKNDKRVLEILNCYDTRDIPTNTTNYNILPYIQIKKLLNYR
jgi:hypothetical protein